ncbi:ABC-2 type transport system permease protein [Arcticibacter pallidicorallinus]|uniref:ABC-2 type transport system permease protein n=1 Tax=Arcticibacter pallidicorallinus TaxID=1259464 RepID=A0A2T0U9Q1_9SPHI|nr:gliding motility-associated ABC transporter permease subunit GldF [Arcticibacter pallidicorallinus]PRY54665.1 ABC-2 type transport system permease protein [Arcticibacter pallidicorallinus]
MLAVFIKEFSSFFSSLVAYIAIGVFLVMTGLFLWVFPESSILDNGYATLDSLFAVVPYLFMFLIPAITMRSLAEERKDGTFELLATRPLSDFQIIGGKFVACLSVIVFTLMLTIIYYFTVRTLSVPSGEVDSGAIAGSYIGLVLLGASFISIGIFASSVSKNQIVSFSLAVFLCFFSFSGFDSLSTLISLQAVDAFVSSLGISEHYQSLGRGVIDSRDVLYFLSFSALFLTLTKTVLGGRKW